MRLDINWKSIDLNLLVAFSALFETQSVSAAAKQLHLSQSAMSHSLARLRVLLDDPLFERHGHTMLPTERALSLASTVESILDKVTGELLSPKVFLPKDYKGVCRIGLTDYAEFIFAPVLFDVISRQAPESQICFVNVNRSNYVRLVEEQKLDVVVGSFPDLDARFQSEHLYDEEHVCLFDESLFGKVKVLKLEQYLSIDHALVSPGGELVTGIDKHLEQMDESRQVRVAAGNFLTIRQLLCQRKLLAIVPKRMAQIEGFDDQLVMAKSPIDVNDFAISLIWSSRQHTRDKNIWLRELVKEEIK
ncbi:LysR family transcriptional regulator [Vibrio sp. vnigr-6D03]|uniref:LysR family transcriptional regulator n=1 Tax=Vibrio sp. vnigr-6D03 TaxID=2058088 RepID=UPI000C3222DF|nr:LysR family transcriptional regulator [Vibrio sp. vnigr-6D03]PKF78489.1 LysR family transcriptional regulator [Vibrio sp. vnigr-6D03]